MSAGDGSEFKSVGSTNGTCRRYLFVMLLATLFGASFWDDYSAKSQWFIVSYIIYIHIHMYIYIILYVYIYTHTYTHIYIHIHIHTHIYIYIYTYNAYIERAGLVLRFHSKDAKTRAAPCRSVAASRHREDGC